MLTLSQLLRLIGGSVQTFLREGDRVEHVVRVGQFEECFFDDQYGTILTLVEEGVSKRLGNCLATSTLGSRGAIYSGTRCLQGIDASLSPLDKVRAFNELAREARRELLEASSRGLSSSSVAAILAVIHRTNSWLAVPPTSNKVFRPYI